jgi:two-component system, cell cycle response regulator DivK
MTGEKILIVDDNESLLEELRDILDCSGYSAITVSDPTAACETAAAVSPDVILLDLKMGNMNGFHVAQALKQSHFTARIPIIAMSGYFPIDDGNSLLDSSQMEACLKKPFGILDMLAAIEKVLCDSRKCEPQAEIADKD